MGSCSAFNGERKSASVAQMQTKADLNWRSQRPRKRNAKRSTARSTTPRLLGNAVHIEHEYAQMAVHLRIKVAHFER